MRIKHLITLLVLAVATFGYGQIAVPFDQKELSYMGRVAMVEHQYAKIFGRALLSASVSKAPR